MFCRRFALIAMTTAALLLVIASPSIAEITAEQSDGRVVVQIDGKPFTEYVTDFNGTPILWPIIGPTGKPMTRAYPMGDNPEEKKDHPHHRSMWFNHGDVNGLSFWHKETIKHREFVRVESGDQAVVVTRNDWVSPDGERVCEDERTLTFATDGDARWIDFDITVKATDQTVKFGDTKEGSMGVRVAASMKVDAKKGGEIVNSEGQIDGGTWGKRAAWVDYHGPVDSETVGIAILNHPSSFRFPTYWHVRTYGLFAANPFGVHDFEGNKEADGSHTLEPGETMTFRYRVLLHRGDEKEGQVSQAFSDYSKQAK
ncbi:MAG TPA: PmoA family protein [Thermoguttaceae bacterium]|nr:PmoA family protein [Thermoguttaceae bacterium]